MQTCANLYLATAPHLAAPILFYASYNGNKSLSLSLDGVVLLSAVSRRELRDNGMTLIFDAKRTNPPPQLYKAMMEFQVLDAHGNFGTRCFASQ